MVKTRSTVQKEREQNEEDHVSVYQARPASTSKLLDTRDQVLKVDGSIKSELQPAAAVTAEPRSPRPASRKGSKSKKSTSSSVLARKKRLEFEAAEERARIQLDLINKKLEADLADIDDEEYSPHSESSSHSNSRVERWLEKSLHEPREEQRTRDHGTQMGELQPPVMAAGTSDATVQMLASALKDLASASAQNGPNTNLLSRISTPRDLPQFSGDPMEWLQFKQAYEESTIMCNFTPKENLWRLRKCLQGQAKESVSALLISATSPEIVMSTLELRFGNPDTIISRILQDIKKLTPVSSEYQNDIVIFSVKVQNFMAAVRAVGREEYLQGMNIATIVLSKLPAILISKWSDYSYPLITQGKQSRLEILSDFLSQEAVKINTTANMSLLSTRSYNNNNRSHAVLLQSELQDNNCQFCKKSKHALPECTKFKKALRKDRWSHVKRHGVCFKCLVSRHDRETCSAPVCDKEECGGAHHKLLHYNNVNNGRESSSTNARELSPVSGPGPALETVTNVNMKHSTVLLKVVPVYIRGPNGVFSANALLDDGSTVSLINSDLAARAGLRGRSEALRVCGAWNSELVCKSTVMTIDISGVDNKLYKIKLRSVKELNLPLQDVSIVNCDEYVNLRKIKDKLNCNSQLKPELLIGQDNYHLLLPLEVCLGNSNEPSATRTPLGWCVHGVVRAPRVGPAPRSVLAITAATSAEDDGERMLRDLHDEVQRSFALDALGVSGKPRQNADEVRATEQLDCSAALVDGRWHVGLPWKDDRCMPDAYPTALKRMQGIERKMVKDLGFAERYRERVDHLLQNNYARELKDTVPTSPRTWYLPHFGVDNPNKKKLRLVFDAASKVDGKSLNDFLLTGPDLLSSLLGIMLRFREYKIAVTGDIKDMFLRVKIRPEDQQALRFIWRDKPTENVKTYVMTSLIFGANCSPFVAQYIKNKNARRYESSLPAAMDAICNSHYMDDYIQSHQTEGTAIEMVKNISEIHRAGGFEMRNWTSNSVAVLESVPKDTLGATAVRFKIGQQHEGERTLGLIWFPAEDMLGFDVSLKRIPENIIKGIERPTKRLMLRVIMSIFDVLGFLAPFTIQGRILMQDAWQLNIGWDDEVSDDIYLKWKKWIDLLKEVNNIRIPRFYKKSADMRVRGSEEKRHGPVGGLVAAQVPTAPPPSHASPLSPRAPTKPATTCYESALQFVPTITSDYSNLQLHIFSDASTKAMSAVGYWRWIDNNVVYVSFIASKCRVMPVKPLTIPKAELQAALLAARLANTIGKEHKLTAVRRYFWCDSTTVLHWIRNNTRTYKTFEANRLGEIDELTRVDEWNYIPTKLNVADLATRETFDLAMQNEWFTGPAFLYESETLWPKDIIHSELDLECVAVVHVAPAAPAASLPVPDPQRFSSWLRLIRTMAAVLKFIAKCRGRTGNLDCNMMERAENLLLKHAQAESFADEITSVKNGKSLQHSSRLRSLTPLVDEYGLLRVGGRIDAAVNIDENAKRPVILDGRHPVAKLIVRHYHVKLAHGNQETVVNELRQKYWVLRLRPTVKLVTLQCMLCKLRKCKPHVPRMGDLPKARIAHHQRPFTYCGLDLFGPMEVTVGRRREKRYGVLFTCLTVRAVHIELVASLTTDSLIMALRRMAARRGWPRHLYSDNGTNLRGADTELRRSMLELNTDVLKTEGINNGMEWSFIAPATPHWGGAWERLIRSVKTSLKVVLNERAPRDEVLRTLLAEVENIVNSRPLMHVSVDPGDVESLTPNHFLLGSSSNLPVIGAFDDSDFFLRKQWRIAQRLADMFWHRWVKEVLPDLLPRKKWQEEQKPLQVDDLVLVVDPNSPRNTWPKGVISQVFPGKDGRVRLVEVRTRTGTWRRSAARVAPISMSDECCTSTGVGNVGDALISLTLNNWYFY